MSESAKHEALYLAAVQKITVLEAEVERLRAVVDKESEQLVDQGCELIHKAKEVKRLQVALRPFAVVTLPDNWPGNCVLTWRDRAEEPGQMLRGAFICYLHHKAQGGPTIADYRRATEALVASEAAEAKGAKGAR